MNEVLVCDVSQGEGVAYRGRVLVELSTQVDGKVDKNVDDICSDDILVAQVNIMQCNPDILLKPLNAVM